MTQVVEGLIDLVDPAQGLAFTATNARGNSILLGSAPSEPQDASGWTGVSLGGCTAIDVASTLRKMRQVVTGYRVRVRGERRDDHPRIYTHIIVEHELHGRGLRETPIRRAIELSAGKYCSVSAMLEQAAKVEIAFRIVDADTGVETTGAVSLPVSVLEGTDG
jgi:putative redox protein